MTLEDFTGIAQSYNENTNSKAVFSAFKMLAMYQRAQDEREFVEFPNGSYSNSNVVKSRADKRAYRRGARILAALATIADNPVYTLHYPNGRMPQSNVEYKGDKYTAHFAFVSQEAAQAFIEELKREHEGKKDGVGSCEIFRVPFMALSFWGIALYQDKHGYEPLYVIMDIDDNGELEYCEILGRNYHNLIPTMALGSVDPESAMAVLYCSEDFSHPLDEEDLDEAKKETK